MAEHKSAEQVLEQRIRAMGTDLGTLYHALTNDVAWMHAKWDQYQQLYMHSPERITLLNSVAGAFFGIIQDTLFENVILHLARLIDPPQSMGKDNLTLRRLSAVISNEPPAPPLAGRGHQRSGNGAGGEKGLWISYPPLRTRPCMRCGRLSAVIRFFMALRLT
jgi:AbiU2